MDFQMVMLVLGKLNDSTAAFLAKSILRVKSEASSGEPASGFSPWANGLSPSVFEGGILFGKFTWRLKMLNFGTQGFQQNTLSSKYIRKYENHEMLEHIDGSTATGSLLQ